MLSAQANPVSLKSAPPDAPWHPLRRLLDRIIRQFASSRSESPQLLPDDLRADVGLGEPAPANRGDAFWAGRRRSGSRDLPL